MGVTGLWKLLEPCGKPVPLETLEGKIVAVDVSIWLNQAMKGYRDGQNSTVQNAHLIGVFHRVCKLLTYKIKPVFVFDGSVPALKRDTLNMRRMRKSSASTAADKSSQKLVQNLLRQEALRAVLGERAPLPLSVTDSGATAGQDMFRLPPTPPAAPTEDDASSDSSSESEAEEMVTRLGQNLHTFDFDSEEFRSLAPQAKHDILSELKDTRKQSSWAKLHEMPKNSDNFSDFQMERLLKRNKFQTTMDEVEAEITKRNTELLHMGMDLPQTISSRQMVSRSGTFLLFGQLKPDKPASCPAPDMEEEGEVDEAGLLDAANSAEYLAGADLFGGKGIVGSGSSAAKVDRQMEALATCRKSVKDEGKPTEADVAEEDDRTPEVFSEMGKKYSNLYLKFSAQWLEGEKSKSPDKAKTSASPSKALSATEGKRPASAKSKASKKVRFDEVPTFSEIAKDLSKLSSKPAAGTTQSSQNRKATKNIPTSLPDVIPVASRHGTLTPSSALKKPTDGTSLQITINPSAIKVDEDDPFKDIFSSAGNKRSLGSGVDVGSGPGHDDQVAEIAEMSDSGDSNSSEEEPSVGKVDGRPAVKAVQRAETLSKSSGEEPAVNEMPSGAMEAEKVMSDAIVKSSEGSECDRTMKYNQPSEEVCVGSRHVSVVESASGESTHNKEATEEAVTGSEGSGGDLLPIISGSINEHCSDVTVSTSDPQSDQLQHDTRASSDSDTSDVDDPRPATRPPPSPSPLLPISPRRNTIPVSTPSPPPPTDPVWEELDVAPELDTADLWEEVDDAELQVAAQSLATEQMALLQQRGRQQRAAATVTDQMYADVQYLLELFGIPYVVAPQEAEAQCAFLEIAGLTHGTITDDSDIWLFGGQRVFKNFFNQSKFVELYQAGDIRGSLGLERGQLVCVAMLAGSDYTLGLETVGCVRALEILAEFPGTGLTGLRRFREWWQRCRQGQAAANSPIRRSLKNLTLPHGFPSEVVQRAYLEPEVDASREPFSWAPPDELALKHLAAAKLGWGGSHTESILLPALRRCKQKTGQQRVDDFFRPSYITDIPVEASQRVQKAARRVRGDPEPSTSDPVAGGQAVSATAGGSGGRREPEAVDDLMDDGMDEVFASLEVPGEAGGIGDKEEEMRLSDALDELDQSSGEERPEDEPAAPVSGSADSSTGAAELPAPEQLNPAPQRARRGRSNSGVSQCRPSKPRTSRRRTDPDAIPANPFHPPRRSVPDPGQSSDTSTSRTSTELSELTPKDRERVLLARRLRERARLVQTEMRMEDARGPVPLQTKPITSQVRKQMMSSLMKENPRLKLEREEQLRRRMGLPSLIRRGRSCRNPVAARSRSTFEQAILGESSSVLTRETGGEGASSLNTDGKGPPGAGIFTPEAETSVDAGRVQTTADASQQRGTSPQRVPTLSGASSSGSGENQVSASASAMGDPSSVPEASCVVAEPATDAKSTSSAPSNAADKPAPTSSSATDNPAHALSIGTSKPVPSSAGAASKPCAGSSQSRLQAWMRDAATPLPTPAPQEAVPQRVMSERRKLEAKLLAAELLKARGSAGGGQRRRHGNAVRRRPAVNASQAKLSESSDSD